MRWWLGLAFAAVAALTAVAVVAELNHHSESAFRNHAEAFAAGRTVLAAETLKKATTPAAVHSDAALLSEKQNIRLYVFDTHGRLLSPSTSREVAWQDVPFGKQALREALSGFRFVKGQPDGSEYVVAVPIHRGAGAALVTYTRQRGLSEALGIIRDEYPQAALIAFALSAALGLLVATLTARRLRRLDGAAQAIGSGDFSTDVAASFPDEVGSLALSIERMRDKLQEAFLALERDRDRLDALLDRLDDGVVVINRQMRKDFANDRARELLGTDDDLPAGVRRVVEDLFATGLPGHVRLTDGQHDLDVSGIPPAGDGDSAIIVLHDQSQAERNERVQREFATNAAHELRTPLASIVTAVEMLQTGAKEDAETRDEFLEVIEREAARLTRLTRALLVLARADGGEEGPRRGHVAVAPLLEQVAASLPARKQVTVAVDCPPGVEIAGDADLLEQAVSSVATNAVQHTDSGHVTLRGRPSNGSVVIEVADTGSGIPPAARRRIFDRFYRAADSEGGFGLGLSIAREAVGALGGEIEVESEVAQGTTVRITLDRAEAPV